MFVKQDLTNFSFPIFKKINDGALLCAGSQNEHNVMTISWGTLGVLWRKYVVCCYVRPSRYTYQFMEKDPFFTLNFIDSKEIIAYCGQASGRTVDKDKECKLTPISLDGAIGYAEADMIIVCRKIYFDDFDPDLLTPDLKALYPYGNYHRFYYGEIINIYQKDPK